MGEEVILSDDRWIEVYRDGRVLQTNKDSFVLGESLTIKISDPSNQYVYEVSGNPEARFPSGGCGGKRVADKKETLLQLPESNSLDPVSIVVAWAEGHTTVKVSKPFVLLAPTSNRRSSDGISLSNLRGREGETQTKHVKSSDRKTDQQIKEIIEASREITEEDLSPEPGRPPRRRRFKNVRDRALFRTFLYVVLIFLLLFAIAFIIRYRHNLSRLVRRWLRQRNETEEDK